MGSLIFRAALVPFRLTAAVIGGLFGGALGGIVGSGQGFTIGWRMWR